MPPPFAIVRPRVVVDGTDRQALADHLLDLTILETAGGPCRCEARFGQVDIDRQLLDFGRRLQILLDAGGGTLFDGRIMAVEGHYPVGLPPALGIVAVDRLIDLRMTRRTRTFVDISDAGVLEQIARDHGLTPQISLAGAPYKVLAQVNQTDFAFICERARAAGADVLIDGNTMTVRARSDANADRCTLALNGNLHEFAASADLTPQRTSVIVSGWDVSGKAAISHEARDASVVAELQAGERSAASVLQSALGERTDVIADAVPHSTDEARALAESAFRRMARRFLTGRGIAATDSRLRAAAFVNVEGVAPLFAGRYCLTEVRHRFDAAAGLRTEFTAEKPGLPR